MLLGCIGDDFTGSSDLANTLAKGGLRTVQYNGVPVMPADATVKACVIALKTRSVPTQQAVNRSLEALEWLRKQGCRQFLYKYCSTFDSTPQGNIGPVLDALSNALGASGVIVCPAFPATGRSVFMGHLFVNDQLLSESGMEKHPLNPMTDPDIRRWLGLQTSRTIGHVACTTVAGGVQAIRKAMDSAVMGGAHYLVIDAIQDGDLYAIGKAAAGDILLSGGSGIALGLPENFRHAGLVSSAPTPWKGASGPVAALCGSCSTMSKRQIAEHKALFPAREVDADAVMAGKANPAEFAEWIMAEQGTSGTPLVYSSADQDTVTAAQKRYGREQIAESIEGFFAALANELAKRDVKRLISAGGETSGAIVSALAIQAFEIGPEIDPGVPALRASDSGMVLALKSGNFGAPDFFAKAAQILSRETCP